MVWTRRSHLCTPDTLELHRTDKRRGLSEPCQHAVMRAAASRAETNGAAGRFAATS